MPRDHLAIVSCMHVGCIVLPTVGDLVCGIKHSTIQTRLLTEKESSFKKALEIALSVEAAEDVRQI